MFRIYLLTILLISCEQQKVSFDTVEDGRRQARENAEIVAKSWRSQNLAYADTNIYMRGDSTVSPECPQGDGWASVDIQDKDGKVLLKLKCSTVSLSIDCLEDKDFKSKSYAAEEGRCNRDLPFPLPKLVK